MFRLSTFIKSGAFKPTIVSRSAATANAIQHAQHVFVLTPNDFTKEGKLIPSYYSILTGSFRRTFTRSSEG